MIAAGNLFQTATKRYAAIVLDQSEAIIATDKKRPSRPSATAGKTVDQVNNVVARTQQELQGVIANDAERRRLEEAGEAS